MQQEPQQCRSGSPASPASVTYIPTVVYGAQGAGQAPQGPQAQPGVLKEPRRATSPLPQAAPPTQQATTREVVVINRVVIRRVGEPFPAWRDHLIAAYRALKPEPSGPSTNR